MKIEDQVVSLEQAKRLKELLIDQKSAFVHIFYLDDVELKTNEKSYRREVVFMNWQADLLKDNEWYSAYTVSEVGVMLPCEAGMIGWEVWYSDHLGTYHCAIRDFVKWKGGQKPPPIAYESEEETMAQAMADTLIYCLENKLITADQVNQSLKQ